VVFFLFSFLESSVVFQIFKKGNGTASPSFCSYSLANMDEQLDLRKQEYDIKSIAGALYAG
jgi:hypothetical protein